MIKKWFKYFKSDSEQLSACGCHGAGGICIDRRLLSRVIAFLLLLGSFIFVAGYFWGQRVAVDQLINAVERDSFSDQMYYSICSLYDSDNKEEEDEEGETVTPEETSTEEEEEAAVQPVVQPVGKQYVAQLAGYSQLGQAQQLKQRLAHRGVQTNVQKRSSATRRGKVVVWYQVVTEPQADRAALDKTVELVKKAEKIREIKIVEI